VVSTFTSGSDPEPGDQMIPPASAVLGGFDEEHMLLEVERICGAPDMSGSRARTGGEGGLKVPRVPASWRLSELAERLTNAGVPALDSGLPGPRMVVHSLRSRPDT
jgi:hypothetical protein